MWKLHQSGFGAGQAGLQVLRRTDPRLDGGKAGILTTGDPFMRFAGVAGRFCTDTAETEPEEYEKLQR